jgi:hypothetical protein
MRMIMSKARKSDIEEFIALRESEKERVVGEIEGEGPGERLARSRGLNGRERGQWRRFKGKMGRPRVGKGARTISLTVEKGLLKRADAYAKRHGMSRARLVAMGLEAVMGEAA